MAKQRLVVAPTEVTLPQLLTIKQTLDAMHTSKYTLNQMRRAGLPVVSLGKRSIRIPLDALRTWLAEHTEAHI